MVTRHRHRISSLLRQQLLVASLFVASLLVAWSSPSLAGEEATPASRSRLTARRSSSSVHPDSLRTYHLGEYLVTTTSPGLIGEPGRTEVPWKVLERRDGGTAVDLAPLVPATRVATNSRGEAVFTVRGASERQVALFLDGVQLDVPWDERVDAALIPTGVVGTVNVVRGVGSVLDGPNTPGGVVHLVSRQLAVDGRRTRMWGQAGAGDRWRGGLLHLTKRGRWSTVSALEHRRRDAFLIPDDLASPYNQPPGRRRANSDLQQTSVYLRAERELPRDGACGLVIHGSSGEKGVPPETHLAGARFWRMPTIERLLVAGQAELVPDEERRWQLDGDLALDLMRQETQAFPDSTYVASAAELDQALETGRDRTVSLRLRATRHGPRSRPSTLGLGVTLRATQHREQEKRGAPELDYSQLLGGVALEWDGRLTPGWRLRAGGGYDHAATPESGDKPERDAIGAPAFGLRLTRERHADQQWHLALGRRSRFPALRELYSGALGRFVPNPDLEPEILESAEVGFGWRGRTGELAVSTYLQRLRDGIVRVALPERQYERRNADEMRLLGLELHGHRRLPHRMRLDFNHAFLRARQRDDDGDYDAPVERRPFFLSYLALSMSPRPAWQGMVEIEATGAQYGLDAAGDRLDHLPTTATCNLRLARFWPPNAERHWTGELYVRLDNVFDQVVFSQPGLPEAGRELIGEVRFEI